jgi:E3 ubiquitin-protein ligase synoviolin
LQVIYVQAFILVILMGKLMRKVFFGQLRAAEFEVFYPSYSKE